MTADEIEDLFYDLPTADFSSRSDMINRDDIAARISELESAFAKAGLNIAETEKVNAGTPHETEEPLYWPDDAPQAAWDAWSDLKALREFNVDSGYAPNYYIRESYFEEYVQEIASDMHGELPDWIVIDWEKTANGVKSDYTTFEFEGVEYYGREG